MLPFITVLPAPNRRGLMALWAVTQDPQVRTCSESEFAIPPHLFTEMPEDLLIGSTVDGHSYVSPEPENLPYSVELWDNSGQPQEPVPAGMVVTKIDECGKPVQPFPEEPPARADHGLMVSSLPDTTPAYACDQCDKVAGSAAGLAAHVRAKHAS